jgi:hypothetical protein
MTSALLFFAGSVAFFDDAAGFFETGAFLVTATDLFLPFFEEE